MVVAWTASKQFLSCVTDVKTACCHQAVMMTQDHGCAVLFTGRCSSCCPANSIKASYIQLTAISEDYLDCVYTAAVSNIKYPSIDLDENDGIPYLAIIHFSAIKIELQLLKPVGSVSSNQVLFNVGHICDVDCGIKKL